MATVIAAASHTLISAKSQTVNFVVLGCSRIDVLLSAGPYTHNQQ